MFFFPYFYNELAEALKTDQGFMDLLRRDAKARKDRVETLSRETGEVSHPSTDTLHDYVLGALGDEDTRNVIEHVSVCDMCAETVREIRSLEKEVTKDLRNWIRDPSSDTESPRGSKKAAGRRRAK